MTFIGMNIAMGIVSLPKLDQYCPLIQYSLTRSSEPSCLVLGSVKIRPLITALEKHCRELYSPYQQLSIDESMIGTKCRLSFIQYMSVELVKWGVKVWVLCDSVNGYICTFDVFTGKDTSGSTVHAHELAYSIVMKLVQSYLKKGHIIYTDNYYSSPLKIYGRRVPMRVVLCELTESTFQSF